ncbi:hypothetical protein [Streptomyces sp. NPDC059786]|uniref:hypothetical protein n=1 Tax=Streptomyces sp. NPDC059786 TaxID=3346946 RepID=UPI0036664B77
MSTSFLERLSNADLAAKSELAAKRRATTLVSTLLTEQFGDELTRALVRETTYAVPEDQRATCPVHQDWRSACIDLHLTAVA